MATHGPYTPSGFTQRVLPVGARRRLAPTSSLSTRTLSTNEGDVSRLDITRDVSNSTTRIL